MGFISVFKKLKLLVARRPLYLLVFLIPTLRLDLRTQSSYINLHYSDYLNSILNYIVENNLQLFSWT